MTLPLGTRLGSYDIVSLLGVGGMGEVYRARDRKLQRHVALKVLPELFATDPERLSRFEREARLLASLNHPNIAHIHGLEEWGNTRAFAMELVDGPTLEDRITQSPLSIDDACDIARQIAEALENAHEAGIIHRDLKPANIKVRDDGTVKVLDFGVAKAIDQVRSLMVSSSTTTGFGGGGADLDTQPGTVVGTVAYMAPEQARGKAVDKRADIWAFGCVLYEMLTGRRLFGGETISDTLAAVLTGNISLSALPASVPAHLRRLLLRCLDRDPTTRLRDIGEVRVALAESGVEPATEHENVPGVQRWRLAAVSLMALLGVIAVGAIAYWYRAAGTGRDGAPAYRFQIATPPMMDLTDFDLSPDGRALAFVALADSKVPAVWIRALDAAGASVLPGTEGAHGVFWSPDSRSVAYVVNRKLYRRAIQGSAPEAIATVSGQFIGAVWSGDTIVYASFPAGLMRVPVGGGEPSALTHVRAGERLHGRPTFLRDGRLLFPAYSATGAQLCTVSLDDQAVRCAATDRSLIASLDQGRLLTLRGGSLLFDTLDVATMTSLKDATPAIDEELHLRAAGNRAAVSYSPARVIAFRPGAAEQRRLVWYDRSGRRGEVVATGSHDNFDLGPDGTRILVAGTDAGGNDIVSLIDVSRGVVSRVVAGERGWANDPVWSPDGREFAYMQRTDRSRITARPVDGGPERAIYEPSDDDAWVEDWSRDGQYLAVGSSKGWRQPRVWLVPLSGGEPTAVPAEGDIVDEYHFSPDGKWLAYNSDASGRQEIYVTPLPPTGERWQISSAGGVQARWRRDGRELFYLGPGSTMMAVTIEQGRGFRASAPRRLFTLPEGLGSPILDEYAVTADGQKFLIAEPMQAGGVQPISVIVNWPPRPR
jgi:eukaryotic-like serine/threonine-protein kinase